MLDLANCISNKTDKYGVKWSMSAYSYVSKENGEEYLGVGLYAEHNFECK